MRENRVKRLKWRASLAEEGGVTEKAA